jgi:hypothetical protein
MEKGTIEITRANLRFNKFRRYSVIVDNKKVASIKNNKTISLSVDPGRHSLHTRIDLFKSNKIQFEIAPGQTLKFLIGDRKIPSWQYAAFYIFIGFYVLVVNLVGTIGIIIIGVPVAAMIYGLTLGKPNIRQIPHSNTGT